MDGIVNIDGRTLLEKFSRLWDGVTKDNLNFLAAGIAFYFLMAVFPALAAVISLFGLFSDPVIIREQLLSLGSIVPPEVIAIFSSQVEGLLESGNHSLGLGFALSLLITVFSATRGVTALIQGLNVVYKEKEKRNYITRVLIGYGLTFLLLVYMLLALALVAGMPAVIAMAPLIHDYTDWLLALRWPILFFTALVGLETIYLFAPSHSRPRWHWISWGSLLATGLWLVMSSIFSTFVSHFGSYNETYGSISAIVVLLLWFWLSALTILLGAEINESFQTPGIRKKNGRVSTVSPRSET